MSTALPPSDGDRPAEGESAEANPATPETPRRAPRSPAGTSAGRSSTRSAGAAKTGATKAATSKSAGAAASTGAATSADAAGTGAAAKASSAAKPAAKKPAASRTRRTTVKPAAIAPEGEAPGIMDATLSAREPLARSEVSPAASATAATSATETAIVTSDTSASPAEPLHEEDTATTKRLPTAAEVYASTPSATVDETTAGPATAATERLDSSPAASTGIPDEPTDASATASDAPATASTTADGTTPANAPHGRTVVDLADRLDDSRFFSSLFDFTFTNYVTRKLAGPVYVVGLVLIGLGIVVGFTNSLTSAIATHAPIGAFVFLFGVLITLVGAMLSVLLLRVGIEVFCAIIEIAQNTRRRRPPGK